MKKWITSENLILTAMFVGVCMISFLVTYLLHNFTLVDSNRELIPEMARPAFPLSSVIGIIIGCGTIVLFFSWRYGRKSINES